MGRCRNCKEKFTPRFKTTEPYCWKEECKEVEVKLFFESKKKKEVKDWKVKKSELKPYTHSKEYKKAFQDEINKLSRLIDNRFNYTCIDCGKPYGKQQDGGHFNSVGSNATIRYNLHNIHSQKSDCNRNGMGSGMLREYYQGLIERYGLEYAEMVDTGLQNKYKYIGLTEVEIVEKLKIVRKLNRDFDTFVFTDAISARTTLNNLIGIYQ
jgi:hypothetical protein